MPPLALGERSSRPGLDELRVIPGMIGRDDLPKIAKTKFHAAAGLVLVNIWILVLLQLDYSLFMIFVVEFYFYKIKRIS